MELPWYTKPESTFPSSVLRASAHPSNDSLAGSSSYRLVGKTGETLDGKNSKPPSVIRPFPTTFDWGGMAGRRTSQGGTVRVMATCQSRKSVYSDFGKQMLQKRRRFSRLISQGGGELCLRKSPVIHGPPEMESKRFSPFSKNASHFHNA